MTVSSPAGYYYKPRIDREHLARYSEGLVGLSACLGGEVARALEVDDWELARSVAGQYGDILGPGNFFLELQDHGLPEQRALNEKLLRLAPETGLPLVVTNDLHYVHEAQADAHDVLLCVGTGNNIDTPNRMKFETRDFWLKSAAQMAAPLPRPARGDPEHPADLRDDRTSSCRSATSGSRTSRCRTARPPRAGSARSASAASNAATGR